MTKSELIAQLSVKQPQLDYRDVELAVKELIDQLSTALAAGQRIEVRGFRQFFAALPSAACWEKSQDR